MVLPAITLGTALAGLLTRMIRSSLAQELHKDYLVTARAKGLGRVTVLLRHALKSALVPVITVLGLQFGALLTGAIITETIFSWPGVGRWVLLAVEARDAPVLQAGILLMAISFALS